MVPPPLLSPGHPHQYHPSFSSSSSSSSQPFTSAIARIPQLCRSHPLMASSSSSPSVPELVSHPWITFPFLSPSGSRLMQTVAHTIATHLTSPSSSSSSPLLCASRTPPDVRSFKNPQGNSVGSVILRSGASGSPIDFLLGSWLHCNLPFGTLNIGTMVGMVNSEIDAPHLLFEFIQTNTDSLVLVLDLLPRKDPASNLEYLKRFYEDTPLESIKQEVQKSPYAQRYEPPTLYIRCVTSPTSILYRFVCPPNSEDVSMDQIVEDVVAPAAHKVVKLWLEGVLTLGRELPEEEVEMVVKRDHMIKTKGVEVDLSSNMPRLFGQGIADKVIAAFRKGE